MKRGFHKLLSEGKGKQFMWLLGLAVVVMAVALTISILACKDLPWQQVVAVMLDPGCFGNNYGSDFLRLPLAVFSLIVMSGLLVSTFSNVVDNISNSVRNGRSRYKINGHVLIIGGGRQLKPILTALGVTADNGRPKRSKHDPIVVVMSEQRPEIKGNYIYYCGRRDSFDDLRSARPEHAISIYIIGEDHEPDHDSKTIRAIELLKELTKSSEKDACDVSANKIYCYATLQDRVSSEVYEYSKQTSNGKLLLVDVINDYEYLSQRLMLDVLPEYQEKDNVSEADKYFLPVIKSGDRRRSHVVILGNNRIAQNVAYTVAHISHYANYTECGAKTCITIIGEDMRRGLDSLIAARQGLFDLSVYTYINSDGQKQTHLPDRDFLDVEWQFVDTYDTSALARQILLNAHNSDDEILTIVVANENPLEATNTALHLPGEVYSDHIAVYMEQSAYVIELARGAKAYGNNITIFGTATDATICDPLFKNRSDMGQEVNFAYEQAYNKDNKSRNKEEAWYKIPESSKYSSIYCALAFPMRMRCFDLSGDRMPIYEAEHRRWMMSVLIMGWKAESVAEHRNFEDQLAAQGLDESAKDQLRKARQKELKSKFIHYDIVPFDELSHEEQTKDEKVLQGLFQKFADSHTQG